MTNDEIKKALETCGNSYPELCKNCPYYTLGEDCVNDILKDALNLITEQEKEIEQLKAENKVLGDGEEKAFINGSFEGRKVVDLEKKQAKIDVLNELKEKYGFYSCYSWDDDVSSLYKIADEMIQELKK